MKILLLAISILLPTGLAVAQGETITPEPLAIAESEVTSLVVDPATDVASYAAVGDQLYSVDDSGEWMETGTLPGGETVIQDSVEPEVLWSGAEADCYRGGGGSTPLTRSDDAGATWNDTGNDAFAPLASWADSGIVLARACPGFHVSVDGGATFQVLEDAMLGMQVTSFAIEQAPEGEDGPVVLVGLTGEGGTSYLYRVDLTDPGQPVVIEELLMWFGISPIEVDDDGVIYVGAPQGVLTSDDGAITWEVSRDGLESTTLEADPLVEFPPDLEPNSFGLSALLVQGGEVIVAGINGIYQLDAESDVMEQVVATDTPVTGLALAPDGSTVLAQTETGMLELPIDVEATTAI